MCDVIHGLYGTDAYSVFYSQHTIIEEEGISSYTSMNVSQTAIEQVGVLTAPIISSVKTINGESIIGDGNITISVGNDANVQAVDTGDVIDEINVDYATTAYVDGLIGDINSILESIINGGGNVSLITFTIAGTEYQAEEGMTWEEWVNSEYSNDTFYINGDYIFFKLGGEIITNTQDVYESKTTSIINNYGYELVYPV